MSTGAWSNDALESLTIPQDAGPSDPAVIIDAAASTPEITFRGDAHQSIRESVFRRTTPGLERTEYRLTHYTDGVEGSRLVSANAWDDGEIEFAALDAYLYAFVDSSSAGFFVGPMQPTGSIGEGLANSTAQALSSGTEVAVPAASWDIEPSFQVTKTQHVYRIDWWARTVITGGVIALTFADVRVRVGSASTSGTILGVTGIQAQSNFTGYTVHGTAYATTDTIGTYKLSLTCQKTAGTGSNISIFSQSSELMRMVIYDLGINPPEGNLATSF